MMYQSTKWGDRELSTHLFSDTPFGKLVELINFHKTGPNEFTIVLDVCVDDSNAPFSVMARMTWWNCSASHAEKFFGIQPDEQNMWGEV
jgi:hypothetical protein